jgi:hypothetical protein
VSVRDLSPRIKYIPDSEVRELAFKIDKDTGEELSLLLNDSDTALKLLDAGYTKPISQITDDKKGEATKTLSLHHCILSVRTELDDICDGLSVAGILGAIQTYPDLFRKCLWQERLSL